MKKTTIWTIVAVIIIALGGGVIYATHKSSKNNNNATYTQAMASGKNAVTAKKYPEASSDFSHAYDIKNTDEAHNYKDQSDGMTDAINSTKNGNYGDALDTVKDVIDQDGGYEVLKNQGKELRSTINDVKDNYEHEIKPLFKKAKKEEKDEQYKKAVSEYKKVLDLPYINGKYYGKYEKQAEDGIKRDKDLTDSHDESEDSNKEDSSSNSSTDKSEKKESSNTDTSDSTGNAGKTGAGAMGDHKVNGKTVGSSQISQLRKKVGSLGYDSSSWSPQDLIDLYRKSDHSDPSQITKSDVKSYLK